MIVVIPSNRQIDLTLFTPLIDNGARFIVVDDSAGSIRVDHPQFAVYNWDDRRRLLGQLEHAIPRRNGACRDLGFWVAWKESDDNEIIVALDDDCLVEDEDFLERTTARLDRGCQHEVVGPGDWFNIFDLYADLDGRRVFPRGFPYSERAAYQPWQLREHHSGPVLFNLGLWHGVLDVNAIDKIQLPSHEVPNADLRAPAVCVPRGPLVSLCSMNMQFRRSLVPAVYQLPMHVAIGPDWVVDRYGDIWGGFILKLLMDVRGDRLSVGAPLIRHLKTGPVQRNIWQEHIAHLVNDEFVALLRESAESLRPAPYLDLMAGLHDEIRHRQPRCSSTLRTYLEHLDGCLAAWIAILRT